MASAHTPAGTEQHCQLRQELLEGLLRLIDRLPCASCPEALEPAAACLQSGLWPTSASDEQVVVQVPGMGPGCRHGGRRGMLLAVALGVLLCPLQAACAAPAPPPPAYVRDCMPHWTLCFACVRRQRLSGWVCAAQALLILSQSFSSLPPGWTGWVNGTNPCVGWTGISCNASGRVSDLCAPSCALVRALLPALTTYCGLQAAGGPGHSRPSAARPR